MQRLRSRALSAADVSARVRLTKSSAEYLATRAERRELAYEALLASGRQQWFPGERVRVYRAAGGRPALFQEHDDDHADAVARDYDVDYYARLSRDVFATRLARALTAEDYAAVSPIPSVTCLSTTFRGTPDSRGPSRAEDQILAR